MPGLLAVSCAPERADRAGASLARVVRAFTALRGMALTAEAAGPTCRVVRFAGAGSAHPALVTSPDGQVTVAAAGWCFAAEAAVAADGVLPHLAIRFAAVGDAALDGLQGQYLALAMDRRDGRLVAAPDQLGLFPVYVAEDDGVAWVTTAALPLAVGLGARLDVEALRALFMESAIRSPRSAFAGIRRASFGERVTITAGRAHVARRWLPYRAARAYRRIEDAADEGGGLLRATARQVRAAWPAWVADLTSGLDSRLVVAALAEPGAPVHVTVNGPDDHLDVAIARLIADRFGWSLEHVSLPPDWGGRRWPLFEEGVALADGELGGHAIDGTLYAKRRLAGRFAASLTGGGGELYREFFWQQEYLRIGRTSALDVPRLLRYRFFPAVRPNLGLFHADWRADYVADQVRTAAAIAGLAPDALNTQKLDAIYLWKSSGHVGRYAGAVWPLLASPAPLATAELLEWAAAVPWRFRLAGRLVRHMITRMHPTLAALPTCYGGSAEPIRLTRPAHVTRYAVGAGARLVRKLGLMTVRHPIFTNPTARPPEPAWNRDLVTRFDAEGLLDVERLRSASLYAPDGLSACLAAARGPDFTDVNQLYAIVTIETLCRLAGIVPAGERL